MLQEYLQKLKDIANRADDVTKSNKLSALDFSLAESIQSIKIKINEIVNAINEGKLKGEDGAPGVDGQDGQDGKDFTYEDFTPEQLESLRGPQGYRGAKGDKGDTGETGPQGPQGLQGIQGETGAKGEKGEQGEKGDKGEKGDAGQDGRDGIDGQDGVDGKQVELQRTTTHIQWRYIDEQWKDLISIDELRAPVLQNVDAYTKEETDTLIADAITKALEDVGVILEDYATKEYVKEQIDALSVVSNKPITKTEVRPEFVSFEENPNAIDRIKIIDYDNNSHAIEILKTHSFVFYSNSDAEKARLSWSNDATQSKVLHYKYTNGQWVVQNKASGITHIAIYTKKPIEDYIVESTIEITKDNSNLGAIFPKKEMVKELIVDYNLATDTPFYKIEHTETVENAPSDDVKGYLKVEKIGERDLMQTVYDTKHLKTYTRTRTSNVWSEWVSYATVDDINKLIQEPKIALIDIVKKNNVDIKDDATLTEAVEKIDFIINYPLPDVYRTEPLNPFSDDLYAKVRYKDKDGYYRIVYTNYVHTDYPCFNPATRILYCSIKADYVKAYVYKSGKWEETTGHYSYLTAGQELESVYSSTVDVGYHSTHANYGQVWKAKTKY